jgi:hypothetical protein
MLLLEVLGEALDVLLPGAGFFVVTVTVRVRILGGLDEPNMVNEWCAVGSACAVVLLHRKRKECVQGA